MEDFCKFHHGFFLLLQVQVSAQDFSGVLIIHFHYCDYHDDNNDEYADNDYNDDDDDVDDDDDDDDGEIFGEAAGGREEKCR